MANKLVDKLKILNLEYKIKGLERQMKYALRLQGQYSQTAVMTVFGRYNAKFLVVQRELMVLKGEIDE